MSPSEIFELTACMETYGGKFVSSLAIAIRYADPSNRQRILSVFPELVQRYGPSSALRTTTRQPMEVI